MDCHCSMSRRVFQKLALVDEQKNLLGYAEDEDGNVVVVPRMIRTKQYAEQQVTLSDGSKAVVFRCHMCQQEPLDGKKLARQIKLAWIQESTVAQKDMSEKKSIIQRTKDLEVFSAG